MKSLWRQGTSPVRRHAEPDTKRDGHISNIKLFETAQIRSIWSEDTQCWYFAIVDVVQVLTDSVNPTDYLKKLRKRDPELGSYLGTNCPQVAMRSASGVQRQTLAGSVEHLLRLIQSIPSPKAEPFKRWLAQVGYERLQEIENPELAAQRMRAIYQSKGYSPEWIEKRVRGIAIRDELTGEWQKRGVKEQREYAILTAEISKATFGMTPSEYRDLKELGKTGDNLRDHMSDLERKSGRKVATDQNYKQLPEAEVRKRIPKNKVKTGDAP